MAGRIASRRGRMGLLFVSPWIAGLGLFLLYPFLASVCYGFTDYSVLRPPRFVGADNYTGMATDPVFWKSLWVVLLFALFSIPLGVVTALGLAITLDAGKRGVSVYRAIFYLPQLVPTVVVAILWTWLFNAEFGLVNHLLRVPCGWLNEIFSLEGKEAISPPGWLASSRWALWALVFMSLWQVGQMAIIYLAKIQDVPQDLYEAASLDGAGFWSKTWHITLPQISPIILFNVIMAIIGCFQVFTQPYIMTGGGPARATHFLSLYIYKLAFEEYRMGYACAVALVLFLVILGLTMLALRVARSRVYYAGEEA
ncbi:MAG: carbohydrate ABC transporter permease [Planctomycetota bacterium]